MTNSHEPSYYEIALTSRQAVVAFGILLICLVSAFFSGLWIGRESTARAQEQLVSNMPPAPAGAPEEGQALEEFEFFEDEQKPAAPSAGDTQTPAPADPVETPVQDDTTLLEDFGGEGDEEATYGEPAAPEGRRRQDRDRAETVEEEPEPAAAPTPAPAPQRPQRPQRRPAAEEPRLADGQVVIQVFSSAELDQAEKVRDRLVRGGHKAYLSPVQVGGRTMHRVRIGPFGSRDQAQTVAEQVRKGYKLDTWVTE